jgi:isocitrate dehydrogenase (NAD+)
MDNILKAQEEFGKLIKTEYERIERMKESQEVKDFKKLDKIVVGVMPGDGIGPIIMEQALRVFEELLRGELGSGKIEIRTIEGMTIENRAAKNESLPAEVLEEVKKCHVLLKGPMTTPKASDPWPNLVSANSLLRRGLEMFAAVRPISMPEKNIDWTFFRENIEGEYIWGNKGIQVNEDLAIDFKIQTKQGSTRIARAAFEYARNNGKKNVTVITKANIVKLTDGNFLKTVYEVGKEYPEIKVEERLVDAMAAKMMDPEFNEGLEVFVLPNLYGDIITDIAAELQGGLGSSASSNIGNRYAMFEAIHGTAPFLMNNNRGQYADPCSLIRAAGMLISHIGYPEKQKSLEESLRTCTVTERKIRITTDKDGATAKEFTDYLLDTLNK